MKRLREAQNVKVQPNKTGTSESYHPNKKNNEIKKKYSTWKG